MDSGWQEKRGQEKIETGHERAPPRPGLVADDCRIFSCPRFSCLRFAILRIAAYCTRYYSRLCTDRLPLTASKNIAPRCPFTKTKLPSVVPRLPFRFGRGYNPDQPVIVRNK
jgi:hypothetical protein